MSRTSPPERRNGFVRIARKLFDGGDLFWPTPFRDRFSRGEAWMDLIQMAAFRDGAVVSGVRLNRGEVCGSLRWFARRWSWSVKEVRTFLEIAVRECRIRARTKARTWARTPSVYALVNYGVYNSANGERGTDTGTDLGTDRARTGHNEEEGKKGRSTSLSASGDYPAEFESAWAAYPRRGGGNSKRDAFTAWSARVKAGATPEEILDGVERYRRFCEATGKVGTEYVKQAVTFFGRSEHFREAWGLPPDPLEQRATALLTEQAAQEQRDAAWLATRRPSGGAS